MKIRSRLRQVKRDHAGDGGGAVGAHAVLLAVGLDEGSAHLARAADDEHAPARRRRRQVRAAHCQRRRNRVLGTHQWHDALGHRPLDIEERVEGVRVRLIGRVHRALLQVQRARVVLEDEEAVAAARGNVHLLPVVLGEHDAAPAAKGGRALAEVGDDVVERAARARDELAVRRAVQPAQRVLARLRERDLLPVLLQRLVVLGLVVELVEVAARVAEAVEGRHRRAVHWERLSDGRHVRRVGGRRAAARKGKSKSGHESHPTKVQLQNSST